MDFQLPLSIPQQKTKIKHQEKIMLMGSCFTEHISSRLSQFKFSVCANPNGILFNPASIVQNLESYMNSEINCELGLFPNNEIWHNWNFHSQFSDTDKHRALQQMKTSVQEAKLFLNNADWLMITLGSAFQYFLKPGIQDNEKEIPVANCHRAPQGWFEKKLLPIETMLAQFKQTTNAIRAINPGLKIVITVSPVRHAREGLMANNRSKARLLEFAHLWAECQKDIFYFPAYELMIDVLRDYRFYDLDMVHPNYQATQYIWEQFEQTYFDVETQKLLAVLKEIDIASNHKPRFPNTDAHFKFKKSYLQKVMNLQSEYPYLNFEKELSHFK